VSKAEEQVLVAALAEFQSVEQRLKGEIREKVNMLCGVPCLKTLKEQKAIYEPFAELKVDILVAEDDPDEWLSAQFERDFGPQPAYPEEAECSEFNQWVEKTGACLHRIGTDIESCYIYSVKDDPNELVQASCAGTEALARKLADTAHEKNTEHITIVDPPYLCVWPECEVLMYYVTLLVYLHPTEE
jgi:hypothetical protein